MPDRVPFRVPPFPLPVRVALSAWDRATRMGMAPPSLDEDGLIAAARRRTGLEDFGGEDFRVALRRMLAALEDEAGLHLLGRAVMRSSVIRALECRLRIQALSRRSPEIFERPVESPVFITGMQRTGTTKLHRLLSCAEGMRPLSAAEALNPAPIGRPERSDPRAERRRLAQARRAERGLRYMSPALFAIHPIEADAPEEDVFLFDVGFVSPAVDASLDVPSYSRWIREIDQEPAYREVGRLIQLLLWQQPGRYLGKTPHHLENLDVLFRVFPDARVIVTHRDPCKVVPSFSSMMAHAGAMLAADIDPKAVGRRIANQTANAVERSMTTRSALPEGAVLDLRYDAIVRDPIGTMRRVFDFLDLEWDPASEERMRQWIAENPQRKYGAHRYEVADFGLDADDLRARFKRYTERFDVCEENGPEKSGPGEVR